VVLLVPVRTSTRWLADDDRFSLTPKIGDVRHASGKRPSPYNHEQTPCAIYLRHERDFGNEVLASMHEVPATIPAHIDDQTFCRVLRDECPEVCRLFLEVLIGAKIHADSLRIR
jgi:hypothetical protein